jgi:bifunctional NMN adenylyltransferase/nudix hydrolase
MSNVGVIVGRFQVPELTEGHIDLINHVADNSDVVYIFLGLSPLRITTSNPLDFRARVQMINETFPEVIVNYIGDTSCDIAWSNSLDNQISKIINPNDNVILYGSRDSFIKSYHGKFKVQELESKIVVSGTEIRSRIAAKGNKSSDFRSGVIWAAYNQYPKNFSTVDIAIFNEDSTEVLLARKPNETKLRFVGGFSSPDCPTFEDDATREVKEETNLDIGELLYLGSSTIDDWRYRSEVDKIKTLFFAAKRVGGDLEAGDDIAAAKWVKVSELNADLFVNEHKVLFNLLVKKLDKITKFL